MRPPCSTRHMHIKRTHENVTYNYIIPVKCKCWECPTCRKRKAKLISDFIKKNFSGRQIWMLTLTDPHRDSAARAWQTLGDKWNLFRTWAVKHYGMFNYIRVIEPHKAGGYPHMHVLVDAPIAHKELVKKITDWGFGWNFHSKRMSASGAAGYVTKYLTKEWPDDTVHELRTESKARIVQASRKLGPIFFTTTTWSLVNYNCDPLTLSCYANEIFWDAMARGLLPVIFELRQTSYLIRSPAISPGISEDALLNTAIARGCGSDCEPLALKLDGFQTELSLC